MRSAANTPSTDSLRVLCDARPLLKQRPLEYWGRARLAGRELPFAARTCGTIALEVHVQLAEIRPEQALFDGA
jgi:hypothetical protein